MKRDKLVLVSGDCVCDHNVYLGNRPKPNSPQKLGVRTKESCGGALLLSRLIGEVVASPRDKKSEKSGASINGWQVVFNASQDLKKLPSHHHAFCLWEPQTIDPKKKNSEIWRAVEPPLGYGQIGEKGAVRTCRKRCGGPPHQGKAAFSANPEIVVIDDADLGFRDAEARNQWPAFLRATQKVAPRWVILKLSGSIGEGDLWQELVERCKNNLIVVVSADELRSDEVRISRGLSWEATVEDLLAGLEDNPILHPLLRARHLIVTFRSDGAFWLDNGDGENRASMLVFDAAMAEGEWAQSQGKGTTFGFMSCFIAAVVRELTRHEGEKTPDFEGAIVAGLSASRELRRTGHGRVWIPEKKNKNRMIENPNPGFPFAAIAAVIHKPQDRFVSTTVPNRLQNRGSWMMLDEWHVHARIRESQRPHYLAARAVAILGPSALERFPVAQFGGLRTVDRKEIESLRTIRQLINDYEKSRPQKEPLCLGVFGPPGAGKSFGVKQIAKAVLGKNVALKTFNLSQFRDPEEIVGALHQVRDLALTGRTPVIFWDEFDANEYEWLQYLLAPMQDGAFQDGPITHPIGMSIFIFAGATSQTYETFGPLNPMDVPEDQTDALSEERISELQSDWHRFVLRKGPDFKSRLAGYLNVLGPNPRQVSVVVDGRRRWRDAPDDFCCPIRRALFIRAQLGLEDGERLELDSGVLRAMLEVPHYKAGARSLVFLCKHLKRSMSDMPSRSDLPGWHLLDMHVDAAKFWELCEKDHEFLFTANELAQSFHEGWLAHPATAKSSAAYMPWSILSPSYKASNVAQALRIAQNLDTVGLRVVKGCALTTEEEKVIRELIDKHIEVLAEAEHNGWMVERMIAGWRYANIEEKNEKEQLHPLLLPYAQLPESQKDKDRWPIRGYVPGPAEKKAGHVEVDGYIERLRSVGYTIRLA